MTASQLGAHLVNPRFVQATRLVLRGRVRSQPLSLIILVLDSLALKSLIEVEWEPRYYARVDHARGSASVPFGLHLIMRSS